MTSLSGIVIAKDAEETVGACLRSLTQICDEVVLVDSGSTDRTIEIAQESGATVYCQEWLGFGPQKEFALKKTQGEWVLWLDADEELDSEAQESITFTLTAPLYDVYEIKRRTALFGRFLDHAWSGDSVKRLFRRQLGRFTQHKVHEGLAYDGTPGKLQGHILHYSFPCLESALEKSARYAALFAEEQIARGRRATFWSMAVVPWTTFLKTYILKLGLLDGIEGFIASRLAMEHTFVKFAKLYELQKKAGK